MKLHQMSVLLSCSSFGLGCLQRCRGEPSYEIALKCIQCSWIGVDEELGRQKSSGCPEGTWWMQFLMVQIQFWSGEFNKTESLFVSPLHPAALKGNCWCFPFNWGQKSAIWELNWSHEFCSGSHPECFWIAASRKYLELIMKAAFHLLSEW